MSGQFKRALLKGRLVLLALPALTGAAALLAKDEGVVPFAYVAQKLDATSRAETAEVYMAQCAGCHGAKGEGNNNGLSLYGSKDPLASAASIHFGRSEPPPLKTVMPAYGAQNMLTQKQVSQLATYIAEFRPPWP